MSAYLIFDVDIPNNDPDYVPRRKLRNLLAKSHMIAVDGV